MLKTLWLINAALFLLAVGAAVMISGQDAAGRAILWFFPVAMGVGLGGSWLLERAGIHKGAVALGFIAPLLVSIVFLSMGRSLLGDRKERRGASSWADKNQQTLALAISQGDTAAIRAAARTADVNAIGADGTTPLLFAVSSNPKIVPLLLELGANPNLAAEGTISPLARALTALDPAFTALLDAGASPNGDGANTGVPMLFYAIESGREDRAEQLIAHGADIRLLDAQGRTALMAAAQQRQWKTARTLLAKGADRTIVSRNGATLASILEGTTSTTENDADYTAFMAELAGRAPGTP